MERPLLFAETPRAGRWNHRFLVPDDLPMSEEELAEQAARARQRCQGVNYLAVIRQVEQPSSGRMADELLVLHGVTVERLDAATRRVLLKRLESRLEDLQDLVQAMDWDQEGKRLLVTRRELTDWFDADFSEELAACRGPAPLTTEESDMAAGGTRRGARWMAALLALVFVAAAVVIWRPQPSLDPADVQPNGRLASTPVGKAELASLEPGMRQLAAKWRLPERQDDFELLCEAVVDKLEADLAIEPLGVRALEQRLPELFNALSARLMSRSQREGGSLRSHLEDVGFQDRLLSMYGGRELDLAAPLRQRVAPDDYDGQAQLKALASLCPGQTKEQVKAFRALIGEAKSLTLDAATAPELEQDTDLVRKLHRAAQLASTLQWPVEPDASWAPLAVLGEHDAAAASMMVRWLGRLEFDEVAGVSDEMVIASVRQFVADKRDFLDGLAVQDPPGKRVFAIRCARLLQQADQLLSSVAR